MLLGIYLHLCPIEYDDLVWKPRASRARIGHFQLRDSSTVDIYIRINQLTIAS
jgi:hypothetical protein